MFGFTFARAYAQLLFASIQNIYIQEVSLKPRPQDRLESQISLTRLTLQMSQLKNWPDEMLEQFHSASR